MVGISGAFVLLLLLFTIPESPKYYYANRHYDETRKLFKLIARKNKAKITNEEIDKFIFEFEGQTDEILP